jgi:hypothetical protein
MTDRGADLIGRAWLRAAGSQGVPGVPPAAFLRALSRRVGAEAAHPELFFARAPRLDAGADVGAEILHRGGSRIVGRRRTFVGAGLGRPRSLGRRQRDPDHRPGAVGLMSRSPLVRLAVGMPGGESRASLLSFSFSHAAPLSPSLRAASPLEALVNRKEEPGRRHRYTRLMNMRLVSISRQPPDPLGRGRFLGSWGWLLRPCLPRTGSVPHASSSDRGHHPR